MPNIPTSDDSNVPLEVEELPPLRHAEELNAPVAQPQVQPQAQAGTQAQPQVQPQVQPARAEERLPHPPPGPRRGPQSPASPVTLQRTQIDPTTDQALWVLIRYASQSIGWEPYAFFMDQVMCGHLKQSQPKPGNINTGIYPNPGPNGRDFNPADPITSRLNSLPFPGVDFYALLKAATEVFLMSSCGINPTTSALGNAFPDGGRFPILEQPGKNKPPNALDVMAEYDTEAWLRLNQGMSGDYLNKLWGGYVVNWHDKHLQDDHAKILPYLDVIRRKLGVPAASEGGFQPSNGDPRFPKLGIDCYGLLQQKLLMPCMMELIWSYWHEEAMLAQTMNAISWRFQNRRHGARDPLANLEIDSLRPLNPFLWGWVQDEQHRLSVTRRAYEYDHHYGFTLHGKAVPPVRGADSRSKFLEAFHNLLFQCMRFYNEDDDTTRIADGFPLLNSIREVHILLTEGGHNQYGDLPWNARMEMLMTQWILARPEMREFIGGRIMVAYPEPWMDRVDTMKTLQGWSNTNVMHFRDLGVFGEQILLGIRFGNWNSVIQPQQAANWARYWRAEIQGYIHAYRAATGVDLTAIPTDGATTGQRFLPPSYHLRARLAEQQRGKALPR